ncbi:MAG: hypothetical protein HN704_03360 [Bacteroidetes bacterium]|nr:hypothetical protein [Bacteroidota bacterium]MBT6686560.1 hypothetical protein [Bacteroidota bacterium]MBT7142923.1 hypothetical protein [Bacteroidota bacterium]MBT7490628.1 hypothetical protein [Bacteroidota bacterium]
MKIKIIKTKYSRFLKNCIIGMLVTFIFSILLIIFLDSGTIIYRILQLISLLLFMVFLPIFIVSSKTYIELGFLSINNDMLIIETQDKNINLDFNKIKNLTIIYAGYNGESDPGPRSPDRIKKGTRNYIEILTDEQKEYKYELLFEHYATMRLIKQVLYKIQNIDFNIKQYKPDNLIGLTY